MPRFLLAVYDNPGDYADISADEMQAIIEKYSAWAEGLAASGHLVGSEKLEDGSGRVLHRRGGALTVIDGPYTETREVLGGYFVLQAAGYDEAVELTKTCPHLESSGTLALRAIEEL